MSFSRVMACAWISTFILHLFLRYNFESETQKCTIPLFFSERYFTNELVREIIKSKNYCENEKAVGIVILERDDTVNQENGTFFYMLTYNCVRLFVIYLESRMALIVVKGIMFYKAIMWGIRRIKKEKENEQEEENIFTIFGKNIKKAEKESIDRNICFLICWIVMITCGIVTSHLISNGTYVFDSELTNNFYIDFGCFTLYFFVMLYILGNDS